MQVGGGPAAGAFAVEQVDVDGDARPATACATAAILLERDGVGEAAASRRRRPARSAASTAASTAGCVVGRDRRRPSGRAGRRWGRRRAGRTGRSGSPKLAVGVEQRRGGSGRPAGRAAPPAPATVTTMRRVSPSQTQRGVGLGDAGEAEGEVAVVGERHHAAEGQGGDRRVAARVLGRPRGRRRRWRAAGSSRPRRPSGRSSGRSSWPGADVAGEAEALAVVGDDVVAARRSGARRRCPSPKRMTVSPASVERGARRPGRLGPRA